MTISKADIESQHLTLSESARFEIEELRRNGELGEGYTTHARCHVCCEPESYRHVNKLIASGYTNRSIVESCDGINARRKENGDNRLINAKGVWVHRQRHFNVDDPAQSIYREIAERRALEADRDYINGVGHILTPYAVMETIMVKGYAGVATQYTPITVMETLAAAAKLQEFASKDAGTRKMADLVMQMDRIVTAMMEVVPEEYHQAILAKVEGREAQPMLERVPGTPLKVVREFTPPMATDEEVF